MPGEWHWQAFDKLQNFLKKEEETDGEERNVEY